MLMYELILKELIKFFSIHFAYKLKAPASNIAIYCQHVTRLGLMGFRVRANGIFFRLFIFLAITNELIICYVILEVMKMEKWKIVRDHQMNKAHETMDEGEGKMGRFWYSLRPSAHTWKWEIFTSEKLSSNLAFYGD